MAAATVGSSSSDRHLDHLHSESLPLVDLRFLSQSELLSLSFCSSSSSLRHLQNDPDLSTPKIDRSVFNESAGSRKQTFSRLRLAPPRSNNNNNELQFPPPPALIGSPFGVEQPLDEEDTQIVSLLRSFFGAASVTNEEAKGSDGDLATVPVPYKENDFYFKNVRIDFPDVQYQIPTAIADSGGHQQIPAAIADSSSRRRKRGRPPKSESNLGTAANAIPNYQVVESNFVFGENVVKEKEDVVMVDKNGMVVDLGPLGSVEDPYGEELRRRTTGMQTEAELLGFLEGLKGEWGSNRKKRKVVDAIEFGEVLPRGWKLMLCVKKRAGHFWLACRRYISPNGQQFVSCKEVSSYLRSFSGLQEASDPNFSHIDRNVHLSEIITSGNTADFPVKDDKKEGELVCGLPISSDSNELERQTISFKIDNLAEVETAKKYKCHKCTMAFDKPDDLLQHLLSSHQKSAKKHRHGTMMTEEAIMINGKYECQLCHKAFEEKHRYTGHFGNHIKDYLKRIDTSGGFIKPINDNLPASAEVPFNDVKIQQSARPDGDLGVLAKSNGVTSSGVPYCEIKASNYAETFCTTSNDAVEKQNEFNNGVAAKADFSSGAVSALFNSESTTNFKPSIETDVLKCTTNGINNLGGPERSSISHLLSLTAERDQTCIVDNNSSPVPVSLMAKHNQEKDSNGGLLAPAVMEKPFTDETIRNRCPSSTKEVMEMQDVNSVRKDGLVSFGSSGTMKDDVVGSKKEQKKFVVPSPNYQRDGTLNNVNRSLTSIIAEATQERNSKVGLPVSIGGETRHSKNNMKHVSISRSSECKLDGVGRPGNEEPTVDIGSYSNAPVEDTMSSKEGGRYYGSLAVASSCNEQVYLFENNTRGTPRRTMEKPNQQKESLRNQSNLSSSQHFLGLKNDTDKMQVAQQNMFPCSKTEFSSGNAFPAGATTDIALESSNTSLFAASANKQKFPLKDSGVYNSDMKKFTEYGNGGGSSQIASCVGQMQNNRNSMNVMRLEDHEYKKAKSYCSGQYHVAFGHGYAKKDADVVTNTQPDSCSKDSPVVHSRSELTLDTRNFVTGSYGSVANELKQSSGQAHKFTEYELSGQARKFTEYEPKQSSGQAHKFTEYEPKQSSGQAHKFTEFGNSGGSSQSASSVRQMQNNRNSMNVIRLEDHQHKEAKSYCSGEYHVAYGHSYTKKDADVVTNPQPESRTKDPPVVHSRSELTLDTRNFVTGSYGSFADELKQSGGQAHNIEDNLNWFYTGKSQEEHRLEDLGNSGKNEMVIGFNSHGQSNEHGISELMWRTYVENDLLSGFVDTPSQMVQPSSCFAGFDVMSDKGGSELLGEKFDKTSGFEQLRSGSIDNMGYNFLTSQLGSQSNESKISSFSAEMAQGFDSSVWPQREALPLLPKLARRQNVPVVCVWCRTEFQYESVESEAQAGSMGFTCGFCRAKYSI